MSSSAELPATQRAWRAVNRGQPRSGALKLVTDLPVPTSANGQLKKGDVLVKVQAGALNPVFYKMLKLLPNFIVGRPWTAEHDLAGVVVDSNGSKWKNGDEVFGWIPFQLGMKTKNGSLCEYAAVPADHITQRPSNISPVQSAGVGLAGMTAYQAIFDVAKLEPGQTLFVNGGSTAVGAFAIMWAKAKGIKVVATASGKNEEYVRKLGADEFIDYTKQDLATYLTSNPPTPKYHVILEAVGLADPSLFTHSEAYLAPGGVFVSVGPQPSKLGDVWNFLRLTAAVILPAFLGGVSKRSWKLVAVAHKQENLEAIRDLLAQSDVKPPVDSVHSFEDALNAYDRMQTGRCTGKVVVKIDPSVS